MFGSGVTRRKRCFEPYHDEMQTTVNGDPRNLPEACTIEALLADLGLTDRPCAVEVNRCVIPRAEHPRHPLAEGDAIEIVSMVGGG